jgi:pSer/pThr/pTyr-binding forkhead associated (FHA) protein
VTVEDTSSTAVLKTDPRLRKRQDSPANGAGALDMGIVLLVRGVRKEIALHAIDNLIIGRTDMQASNLPDIDMTPYGGEQRGVSRQHARLHYTSGELTITDLESANGTFLNGVRLDAGARQTIKDGDEITLGQLAFRVTFA